MNDSENCTGRVTVLELDGEWMGKKVVLRALFVGFQGIIEDLLEIGWRICGGSGGVRIRHKNGRSEGLCSCSVEKMRCNTAIRATPRVQETWETIRLSATNKRANLAITDY